MYVYASHETPMYRKVKYTLTYGCNILVQFGTSYSKDIGHDIKSRVAFDGRSQVIYLGNLIALHTRR